MKLKNMGAVPIAITPGAAPVEGEAPPALSLEPGAISENIDDTQGRKFVADSGGALGIAPESEHTAEELATIDNKPEKPAWDPLVHPVEAGLRAEAEAKKKAAEGTTESTTAPEPVAP